VIFELYGSNMDYVAVSIDFPDGNTKPVADAQSVTAYLDTPQSITLTGSDDDVADTLTYSVYLSPTNGVISGTGVNITYTPTNGYTGPDSFVFKVNDGKICSFATVSITVDLPAASVVASDDAAAETGPDGGAWTISRTGETGTSMTVFFALGGTATLTNDYTVDATSPITLPAGQTNITVNLTTVDDSVFDEGNETAILTILPDAAYSIGSASGTITIADNDFAAPMVSNYSVVADAETSATISGWVTSGGVVQAWICWGLADGGTLATSNWDNVVSMGAVNIGAEFPTNLTGLSTNVTYWYRCYVTNSLGSDWSDTATAFSGVPAGGTGGGGATPVSGAYLEWDASRNSDPNNWTSVTANTYTWTFAVAGQTPAIVTDPRFDLVTKAYSFPDSRDEAGNASLQSIGAGSGQPATFEFVLDIDAVNGIIFESGATGDGIQFDYNNGDLRGYIKESHDTLVSYTLTAEDLGRFIHVVFVADQVNDLHQLYVDGELKSSKAWTGSPWAGGDGAALGGSSGNQANGNVGDFNGHIALFRYYDGKAFTAEEVTTNFNALSSGGVIANLAPTGVTSKAAHINASLGAAGTNYDVYVYWGTVNEGTNAAAWTASAQVGSWTNVATEVSYPLSGLASEQTYYYAFRASNVVTNVWAQPSWQFMTLVAGAVTTNHSVPHSWLASQNASWTNDYEIAATNDPDSDGFTTAEEYWSGTDPQDGSSYLRIEDVESLSGNVNLIWLHSKADAGLPPIIIQWRASMLTGAWTYAGQNTPSDGTNTWDALMLQGGFYRLAVTNMP
jgi:hypothetical protein